MKRSDWLRAGILSVGVMLVIGLFLGKHSQKVTITNLEPPVVKKSPKSISAPARVVLKGNVVIVRAMQKGKIDRVLVKVGDRVQEGQTMIFLNGYKQILTKLHASEQGKLNPPIALLEAQLLSAIRQDSPDRAKLARELLQAQTNNNSNNKLSALHQDDWSEMQTQIAKTTIKAPIGGQVLRLWQTKGEIAVNTPILEIGDIERIYAVAKLTDLQKKRIMGGETTLILSHQMNQELRGEITQIKGNEVFIQIQEPIKAVALVNSPIRVKIMPFSSSSTN